MGRTVPFLKEMQHPKHSESWRIFMDDENRLWI